jgi:hypothetical protein
MHFIGLKLLGFFNHYTLTCFLEFLVTFMNRFHSWVPRFLLAEIFIHSQGENK